MLVPFGLCLLLYIIVFILAALLLQICHCTARLSYIYITVFFLGNKGLSWDNYILIEERKTMNSSILVIHVNRVNSDSGNMKMARYAEISTQSRCLSC